MRTDPDGYEAPLRQEGRADFVRLPGADVGYEAPGGGEDEEVAERIPERLVRRTS